MTLDRDDRQIALHNYGNLAEHVAILRDALRREGFSSKFTEELLIEWWKITLVSASQPDLAKIFKLIQGEEE